MIYFSATQAYNQSNEIINNFEAVYLHIAEQCMQHIRRHCEFHFNRCTFQIPSYVMGYALFDTKKVRRRLRKHLRSLEYKVKNGKNSIVISWEHIGNKLFKFGNSSLVL